MQQLSHACTSADSLVKLFVLVLGLKGIVSVVGSIVISRGSEPFV